MQRSDVSRSAVPGSANAKKRTPRSPTAGAGTPARSESERTRLTTLVSRLALLIVVALVGVIACAGPTTGGHDHVHASCFQLVTGHGAQLSLSNVNTADVENPAQSGPPPTPTRVWSDAARWPGGKLPEAGDNVVIPVGEVVLLDVSTPQLNSLMIAGSLVFDRQDLELSAGTIEVRGGMYVGSAQQPFTERAVITVGSEELGEESPCFGYNYLGLVHGTLEIYGDPVGPAWTRLAASVAAGATSVVVDDASGWREGDRIAIASTDFYSNTNGEAMDRRIEVRTISAKSGNTLSFEEPLKYARYGENQTLGPAGFPTTVLESRAEVMRLDRNVTVRGVEATADAASPAHRFGSHIKALGESRVRLDSIELTAMGQSGVLMRYPVHFHLQGEAALGSFVRNSSLHHLYNRCITIHGSSGVLLEGNAAYNTYGHCYFFEDGAETRNVLKGNFGMMAREPALEYRLIPTDGGHMGPSIFWITNPDNVLVNNVAAHSAGSGFWYSLPEHPTGPSFNIFDGANMWPRRTPLGRFEGNLAHSNQNDGLHVDRGPNQDTLAAETASYRPRVDPTNKDSDPAPAYFTNFVAYKHRGEAAWFRGDHTHLVGALLADNAVGATFASNASGMSDSVVVFRSANLGHAEPWEPTENGVPIPRPWDSGKDFPPRGFQFYDGQVYVKDSYFAGFEPFGQRLAGALSFLDHTSFSLSPLSFAEGLTFHEGTTRVMLADMTPGAYMSVARRAERASTNDSGNDGYASGMFIDLDGSITGAEGYSVTVNNPMMHQPGCTYRAEWNAQVCAERFASLTYNNTSGRALELAPLTLHQGSVGSAASHTMFGSPKGGTSVPNSHFRALVPLGNEFHYQHGGNPSDELTIELGGVNAGDTLIVSLPYAGNSPYVYRDWWVHQNSLIQRYGSLNLLRSATDTGYFYEEGRLYLKLQVRPDRNYAHLTVCRVAVCN